MACLQKGKKLKNLKVFALDWQNSKKNEVFALDWQNLKNVELLH